MIKSIKDQSWLYLYLLCCQQISYFLLQGSFKVRIIWHLNIKLLSLQLICVKTLWSLGLTVEEVKMSQTHKEKHFFLQSLGFTIHYPWCNVTKHLHQVTGKTLEKFGQLEKVVETLACNVCSHTLSQSPKLPLMFLELNTSREKGFLFSF